MTGIPKKSIPTPKMLSIALDKIPGLTASNRTILEAAIAPPHTDRERVIIQNAPFYPHYTIDSLIDILENRHENVSNPDVKSFIQHAINILRERQEDYRKSIEPKGLPDYMDRAYITSLLTLPEGDYGENKFRLPDPRPLPPRPPFLHNRLLEKAMKAAGIPLETETEPESLKDGKAKPEEIVPEKPIAPFKIVNDGGLKFIYEWRRKRNSCGKKQGVILKAMLELWTKGKREMSENEIIRKADAIAGEHDDQINQGSIARSGRTPQKNELIGTIPGRLRDSFRKSPLFGKRKLIEPCGKAMYKLNK